MCIGQQNALKTSSHVVLKTDRKFLVSVLTTKVIDKLTLKIQRMRLRLLRFSYAIRHIPGKALGMADVWSKRPLKTGQKVESSDLKKQVEAYVSMVTRYIPPSNVPFG